MTDAAQRIHAVTEATWPAARHWCRGPWTIRNGAGGGKRVCATTAEAAFSGADFQTAEADMRALNQPRLFMVRQGETALDDALDARGYRIIDPVNLYVAPVGLIDDRPIPRVTTFNIWEPLAIMREIWAEGEVFADRIAVMQRCKCPKTGLFGRANDHPSGVGYVAVHDGMAMVHALHVRPAQRRHGSARWLMRHAARWARAQRAEQISALCVRTNDAANQLYISMGFALVGQYHYRIHPDDRTP